MKYIRTKDGIIDVDKNFLPIQVENNVIYEVFKTWDSMSIRELGIAIKQADTIEELCDEFVILPLDQNKKPIHHFLRTPRIDDISHFINDSHIIYGAIWTDKGLIYVAKMNSKGELELL